MQLQIYSNGLYESTLHRVINNSSKYRVSVVYFYEVSPNWFVSVFFTGFFSCLYHFPLLHSQTNFDAAVEPLNTYKTRINGDKKFERAIYGEHLVKKVLTNFVDE